jgi:hypothetical protein
MNPKNIPTEVEKTRAAMLAFLPKVPTWPYSDCTASERAKYDRLRELRKAHEAAVKAARTA